MLQFHVITNLEDLVDGAWNESRFLTGALQFKWGFRWSDPADFKPCAAHAVALQELKSEPA